MKREIPLKGGDEYDGLTKARRNYFWKPGQLKKIKRGFNKRARAAQARDIRKQKEEG